MTHRKDLRIILKDFDLVLNDGDKAVIHIGQEEAVFFKLAKDIFLRIRGAEKVCVVGANGLYCVQKDSVLNL